MEAREAKKKEKKKGGRKNKGKSHHRPQHPTHVLRQLEHASKARASRFNTCQTRVLRMTAAPAFTQSMLTLMPQITWPGPLDVDKQCGVINDKGLPCSRSLTCKSHSMGAKRAVEGRSRPYDVLLFEWQKATNPTFVAKLEEKEKATAAAKAAATTGAKEGKKKKGGSGGGSGNAADGKNGAGPTNTSGLGDEDPEADMYAAGAADAEVDAELFAILTALTAARERALPLATRGFGGMYVARAKRLRACHELLREGLRGVAPGQGLNARSSQPLPAGVSGQNRGITAGSAQ